MIQFYVIYFHPHAAAIVQYISPEHLTEPTFSVSILQKWKKVANLKFGQNHTCLANSWVDDTTFTQPGILIKIWNGNACCTGVSFPHLHTVCS